MNIRRWISITLLSLVLVALLGVLLRYKITFSLPQINQKFLQHSHSHFAMSGWLTQILMILLSHSVSKVIAYSHFKKYNFILFVNLVASYGMLVSFVFQGYGAISIFFSSLSVLVIYYFGVQLWRDINTAPRQLPGFIWFKAALIFAVLSSFGVAMLVYLMVTNNVNINIQQATTYFYLHFQYNGWLIFACLGLFINIVHFQGIKINHISKFFWVYAGATIPAYFLSTLWMRLPLGVYLIVVICAVILFAGWGWLYLQVRKRLVFTHVPESAKWLLILSAIAFTIKAFLQAGSVIPSLNNMAFGYRPIVIGYLHLVFLGVITLFVLGYLLYAGYLKASKTLSIGLSIFVVGIILNELALMVQGLAAMRYYNVPFINEILFGITVTMLAGTIGINIGKSFDKTLEKPE